MKNVILAPLGVVALLALAACDETTSGTPAISNPSTSANPMFPDVGFAPEVSNAAVDACRNAVDAQTDGGVDVVGSEFSQAASVVYLTVGPQRAPWRCLTDNSGNVSEVMFVGSEGAA
jgi:hypothetical protein